MEDVMVADRACEDFGGLAGLGGDVVDAIALGERYRVFGRSVQQVSLEYWQDRYRFPTKPYVKL
jgi:hypothetical protein